MRLLAHLLIKRISPAINCVAAEQLLTVQNLINLACCCQTQLATALLSLGVHLQCKTASLPAITLYQHVLQGSCAIWHALCISRS